MKPDPHPIHRKTTFAFPEGGTLVFRGEEVPITSFIQEQAIQQYRAGNGEVCREERLATRIIINED